MRIVPAIDIRGGKCVNLVQGDYGKETIFSDDPLEQAKIWWRELQDGILHIVDLDGAKSGKCEILPFLKKLGELGIPYEVGGGIRSLDTIETIISANATRVILGTAVIENPELIQISTQRWQEKIVVAIDAKNGKLSLEGWTKDTNYSALEIAQFAEKAGASRIIYTDILSDGMMKGPNFETTRIIAETVQIPVTMSGGVSSLGDIQKAKSLERYGIDEIIVGRALYLKKFSISDAKKILSADSLMENT
ncbi:MAG: 1-(5-phosphoribosyl)-5-[(5-phosphoribosylamino)methylideneamino]imidazole-4-carboxamide isomerase [Candidatus Hydrogenedens sp.]|nr:1-(5-phosphoribosyl)-5-[(5-phosphoribosylamino)methylideneamino]imidazole-4-carboxamide isomerase [Candidatus Hydrogenedens sp.]